MIPNASPIKILPPIKMEEGLEFGKIGGQSI